MKYKNNISKIKHHELTFQALFDAYHDCRKHKRKTLQCMEFEFDYERNLAELYEELVNETYEVGSSICFVVTLPKIREVWAGAFRDRIVHHLIYNALKDRFQTRFVQNTFSCIPDRGTLYGIKMAKKYARIVSNNYTKRAYYIKMDISSFFNSIDKDILYNEISRYIHEPWLQRLVKKVVYADPLKDAYIKSDQELFDALPKHKSFFHTHPNKGLPIGNLTSQFFSNVYLNSLDQFIMHKLKCKHFCRYVDDIIIFDENPKRLNYLYAEINKFMIERLALQLNHRKKTINTVCKGFDFLGQVVKPNRTYMRTTIIKKTFRVINEWKKSPERFSEDELKGFIFKINSYLGMFKHVNGYNLRKKICQKATTLYTLSNEDFSKMTEVKRDDEKSRHCETFYKEICTKENKEEDWHLRHENWENCQQGWKVEQELEDYYGMRSVYMLLTSN